GGGAPAARRGPPRRRGSGRARRDVRLRRPSRSHLAPQRVEDDRIDLLDSVNAVLEILLPGPTGERLREVAVIAELRQSLAQLSGQGLVDVEPLVARRLAEDLVVEAVDAPQLLDR